MTKNNRKIVINEENISLDNEYTLDQRVVIHDGIKDEVASPDNRYPELRAFAIYLKKK